MKLIMHKKKENGSTFIKIQISQDIPNIKNQKDKD